MKGQQQQQTAAPQVVMIQITLDEWKRTAAQINEVQTLLTTLLNKEKDNFLTPKQVCEIFSISRSTFENFWRAGKIKTYKFDKSKRRYVKRIEIEQALNGLTQN